MDESAIYSGPFCADHAKEQNSNQMFEKKEKNFSIEFNITGFDGSFHTAQSETDVKGLKFS